MVVGRHQGSVLLGEELGERAGSLIVALDTKADCVAIIGASGKHLDVNARLTSLLGYEPEQVWGKTKSCAPDVRKHLPRRTALHRTPLERC